MSPLFNIQSSKMATNKNTHINLMDVYRNVYKTSNVLIILNTFDNNYSINYLCIETTKLISSNVVACKRNSFYLKKNLQSINGIDKRKINSECDSAKVFNEQPFHLSG